jgi:hypothetical protein
VSSPNEKIFISYFISYSLGGFCLIKFSFSYKIVTNIFKPIVPPSLIIINFYHTPSHCQSSHSRHIEGILKSWGFCNSHFLKNAIQSKFRPDSLHVWPLFFTKTPRSLSHLLDYPHRKPPGIVDRVRITVHSPFPQRTLQPCASLS